MAPINMPQLLSLGGSFALKVALIGIVYCIGQLIYNVYFHPLRAYPGPLTWRASRLPFIYKNLNGTLPTDILLLFEKYGPVVRIAPNELAYADSTAWKDILGHNPKGEENGKWTPFYRPVDDMPKDIISADRELHTALRRQLSHGFSDRSMREQEPIIKGYVDLLMARLRENCSDEKPLDIVSWYNFTTFDVIGDLAFGESFGCLQSSNWHVWVQTIFKLTQMGVMMQSAAHYPWLTRLLISMIPKSFTNTFDEHNRFAHNRVAKRIEMGKVRHDLIEGLLMKQDDLNISQADIQSNASLLIIAGSETTATLLSGVTYLLLSNPETLARLTHEVRSTFASEEEITINSVAKLTYMLACLEEALRNYPPVPVGLPRVVPKGGKTFCGRYVPEDTHVGVWQWAANHYSDNFVEPFAYRPERFLAGENSAFAADKREALQPFSYGPRNCIGKNLANAEMRTILARLVFNFDLKLSPESEDWIATQKIFSMWKKEPLWVYLKARV